MYTTIINANGKQELLLLLDSLCPEVPPRTMGRTSNHTEMYAIVGLLKYLCERNEFKYPICLSKGQRPDFKVEHPDISIGIEHTEAVCPNAAQLDSLRVRGLIPDIYFARKSIPGEKKKSAKKLIEEIKNNHLNPPWMGSEPEENWAAAMAYHIHKKDKHYQDITWPTNEKWLLIYDNWRAPALDVAQALVELEKLTQTNPATFFEHIFILSNKRIHQLSNCSDLKNRA
ncbi:MAG: hypothetical protein U1F46_10710 [Marinagarivorans sp.]